MSESAEEPGFNLGLMPAAAPPLASAAQPYRVLARKYRPQTFAALIGQDAMVQTLGNAIRRGRLAHAFLLTGVRGVGKTSTARLIAKALNCIGPDGGGGPTIDPCGVCEPCTAISEGRHIDVVEMDAASNTGVDDVREIIEAVRYAAVSARYKVYIIDEVHMLSKNAFNALLKTLEEPPPHVKFLFATTEIQKVPVTVLSRCQRFDLRRISAERLQAHFDQIARAESVTAEADALAMIARAAEGSVRDGLSILDQAIAHADMDGGGVVTARQVRDMLGLSDRGAMRRLFGVLLVADAQGALAALAEQRDLGVDPLAIMRALLEICHATTLVKSGAPRDAGQADDERTSLEDWAARLSFVLLHRLWQMLLKGHDDVARAADPVQAADMAVLRVIHASSLPDPGDLARQMAGQGSMMTPTQSGAAPVAVPPVTVQQAPADFAALIAALEAAGRRQLALQLHDQTGLVSYAPPELTLKPLRPLPDDFVREVATALKAMTDMTWQITLSQEAAAPSFLQQEEARENAARDAVLASPMVQAALAAFPDAELLGYDPQPNRSAHA
jgi:DNA polymerase III subunit gamma/tau